MAVNVLLSVPVEINGEGFIRYFNPNNQFILNGRYYYKGHHKINIVKRAFPFDSNLYTLFSIIEKDENSAHWQLDCVNARMSDWEVDGVIYTDLNAFITEVNRIINVADSNTSPTMTILTGSGLSDPMPNGTQSNFNITVAGVTSANLISINVTNAGSFPAGVIVVQETLIANDTIEIVLENQSGSVVPTQTVNIAVITS